MSSVVGSASKALVTLAALVRFKKLQEPIVILLSGAVGMALHALR